MFYSFKLCAKKGCDGGAPRKIFRWPSHGRVKLPACMQATNPFSTLLTAAEHYEEDVHWQPRGTHGRPDPGLILGGQTRWELRASARACAAPGLAAAEACARARRGPHACSLSFARRKMCGAAVWGGHRVRVQGPCAAVGAAMAQVAARRRGPPVESAQEPDPHRVLQRARQVLRQAAPFFALQAWCVRLRAPRLPRRAHAHLPTCTRTQRTPAEPPCGPVAARCACRVLPCVQRWYRGCADGARRRGVGGGVLPRELRGVFVGLLLPPQSAAARACCAGPDQAVRAQSTCDGTCGGNR